MNVGEKVSLYKDKLGFKNYQEFGKTVGVSGDWINELSKKDEIKFIDMNNLTKLCSYLNVTIDQLVRNDDVSPMSNKAAALLNINENCNDIGAVFNEIVLLLDKEDIRLDGILLNDVAKQACKDALDVVRIVARQYL
jgi:DNA-binding Xre family transcriptional regulator